MDALQNDIDNLEREKVDMKKRLDAYSKKSLLADLARHASSSSSIAAVVAGTEIHSDLNQLSLLSFCATAADVCAKRRSLDSYYLELGIFWNG